MKRLWTSMVLIRNQRNNERRLVALSSCAKARIVELRAAGWRGIFPNYGRGLAPVGYNNPRASTPSAKSGTARFRSPGIEESDIEGIAPSHERTGSDARVVFDTKMQLPNARGNFEGELAIGQFFIWIEPPRQRDMRCGRFAHGQVPSGCDRVLARSRPTGDDDRHMFAKYAARFLR